MKFTTRLDYNRLAEVLAERNMVSPDAIRELLQASHDGGQLFPEALVESNLVSDWDLSAVVCEIFQLPFLPVSMLKPPVDLLEMFAPAFLRETGVIPLGRYGNVLTIVMPALVQADTLALMSAETDLMILPIVGTVSGNRKWLKEHCVVKRATEAVGWDALFEEGDKAVQNAIASTDLSLSDSESPDAELASLEFTDDDDLGSLEDVPSLAELGGDTEGLEFEAEEDAAPSKPSTRKAALPPPPSFG